MKRRSTKIPGGDKDPDDVAASWMVRLDSGSLSGQEQMEFDSWLSESSANYEAFQRAKRAWGIFEDPDGRLKLNTLRESALAYSRKPPKRLLIGMGVAGVAASLLVIIGLNAGLLWPSSGGSPQAAPAVAQRTAQAPSPRDDSKLVNAEFATAKAERRTVDLADGSVLTLNTDSAVRVDYTSGRRAVELLRGQVLFEVAKDHHRPFVVQAGDRLVTALGTVFEVRLDQDSMKVVLVEGKVVVDAADKEMASAEAIMPMVMSPGQELVASFGSRPKITKVNVEKNLLWSDGFVEFNDDPLTDVVQEMNRYSNQQLVLADAASGRLRLSGVFRVDDPERFAAIVGELLPIQSRRLANGDIELTAVDASSTP